MRVSVIIPTLDEAESIATGIDRAWEAGADQVIIADGGSRDATIERVAAARAELVSGPPGRGRQLSQGAAQATGDVLLFLHADCWLPAGTIDQVRRALTETTVAATAFRQSIDAPGFAYRLLEWGNGFRARRRQLPYGDQGIAMRRATFESLGGFAEVPLLEDVLLMRAARRQGRIALLPGPLHISARRWQKHGVIRQTMRNWTILTAFALGVSPERLARWYRPHAR
ncbi:MAG: TIGR04283 family arsenosugar biosynthesis glycosyltransferase [Pirellulales bacterium]|nr:TIGR04283 family arsenosugar biosynthesis glycosyltransferase [Pirellulales bacterium]